MATPPPFPWTNTDDDWYAALESEGRTYGLARRRHDGDLIEYEVLVPETGQWIFTSDGAGYFTGIGGVTDAEPHHARGRGQNRAQALGRTQPSARR